MSVAGTIERKLAEAFGPASVRVVDESHLHAGHAGARPEGETHFRVEVTAEAFRGKSRLEGQRAVYGVLREELEGPVHALSVTVSSPDKN